MSKKIYLEDRVAVYLTGSLEKMDDLFNVFLYGNCGKLLDTETWNKLDNVHDAITHELNRREIQEVEDAS